MKALILIGGLVTAGLLAFSIYWIVQNVTVRTSLENKTKKKRNKK